MEQNNTVNIYFVTFYEILRMCFLQILCNVKNKFTVCGQLIEQLLPKLAVMGSKPGGRKFAFILF